MAMQVVEPLARDPLAGTRYRALGRLGGGVTSDVFEAVGPRGVRCAVKVLRALHEGYGEPAKRLAQEAQALAALDHPHLVPVLDAGFTDDGRPWFAMPRLPGETLRERLHRDGPLAPARACAWLVGLLEGLDVAHAAGVVHRDIKPANIFVTKHADTERLVLLDFGIAKIRGASIDPTTGAHVIGTPRYLSPEQVLGGLIDPRTDVYAAGIVLFEMIAGASPYEASGSLEMMRAHVAEEPRRLRERAKITPELDHAVARALAKSPARRWPSARAFAAVLERAVLCEQAQEARR